MMALVRNLLVRGLLPDSFAGGAVHAHDDELVNLGRFFATHAAASAAESAGTARASRTAASASTAGTRRGVRSPGAWWGSVLSLGYFDGWRGTLCGGVGGLRLAPR